MANETALTPAVMLFDNAEFGNVRVILDNEGDPLFCLPDLCRALALTPSKVAQRLDDDVLSKYTIIDSLGRTQMTNFVNLDGFFDSFLDSRKPIAKRFRKWVTHDVLPEIYKTGAYNGNKLTPAPTAQMTVFNNAVKDIGETAKNLETVFGVDKGIALAKATQIAEDAYGMNFNTLRGLLPSAEHSDLFNPTGIGKILGITAEEVNNRLDRLGLQVKTEKGRVLTDDGKAYGAAFPFVRNGHSGFQIRWFRKVVDVIRKSIAEEEI